MILHWNVYPAYMACPSLGHSAQATHFWNTKKHRRCGKTLATPNDFFFSTFFVPQTFCIAIEFVDVIITCFNYEFRNRLWIKKIDHRYDAKNIFWWCRKHVDLWNHLTPGYVNSVFISDMVGTKIEPLPPAPIAISVTTQPTGWCFFFWGGGDQTRHIFFLHLCKYRNFFTRTDHNYSWVALLQLSR